MRNVLQSPDLNQKILKHAPQFRSKSNDSQTRYQVLI